MIEEGRYPNSPTPLSRTSCAVTPLPNKKRSLHREDSKNKELIGFQDLLSLESLVSMDFSGVELLWSSAHLFSCCGSDRRRHRRPSSESRICVRACGRGEGAFVFWTFFLFGGHEFLLWYLGCGCRPEVRLTAHDRPDRLRRLRYGAFADRVR